jgi:hemoglobin/transferrin/lactoferrin receptor protein
MQIIRIKTEPFMHHVFLSSALIALAVTLAAPALAEPGSRAFHIGPQPLATALNAFGLTTGWQLAVPPELDKGSHSGGASGQLMPEQALVALLAGTGLSYRKVGEHSVVLVRQTAAVELAPVTVSATRRAQAVTEVPATVSVIERQVLDRSNVNTIQNAVRYEPGVSVGGSGQRSGITGYNIRGIDGDRVLTQIDGVAIPERYFFGPYAQTQRNYVDPEIIKRLEILRGPASSLYGSTAIGGAVSYYTLDPDDIIQPGQNAGARLKAGYSSSDNSWLKSGTLAGRRGNMDALLHVSQRDGHETESFGNDRGNGLARTAANPEDTHSTSVLAKAGWNYAEDGRVVFTYERFKGNSQAAVKSAIGGPFIRGTPSGMYRSRDTDDTRTRERFGIAHDLTLDSLLADEAKWSLNYQVAKTDEQTTELYVPYTRQVLRHRDTSYEDRQWTFDGQLQKAFALGATGHDLTYGATLKRQKVTSVRSGHGICLANGLDCRAGQPSAKDYLAPESDFPDPVVDTYSLFAQDDIRVGNWSILPGARYDYTRLDPTLTDAFLRTLKGSDTTTYSDAIKTWHRLSPKLGVTYAFSDATTWYGQYAEGFRTPTAKALYGRFQNPAGDYVVAPNPNLEPEKSRSVETGLRGYFDRGSYELAVFHNTYRDFIDENQLQGGYDQVTFQSSNIRHATIRGAEAKGRLNLDRFGAPQGLYTQGSIAYAHGRNDDTGQPINSINPLTGVLGIGYDQPAYGGLLSWTLVKRKSRVDTTSFNTPDGGALFKTPGFGTLDLTGYYALSKDITLNAGLYNLADKKYWLWDNVRGYDSVGEASVTAPANLDRLTQPGRNLSVNLVWNL